MKYLYFSILISLLFGCKAPKKQINLPEKSEIFGIASPIVLGKDSTNIYLEDFFNDISAIDSVSLPQGFEGEIHDSKILSIKVLQETCPPIIDLKIWAKGYPYSIILKNLPEKNYHFSCQIDTTKFGFRHIIKKQFSASFKKQKKTMLAHSPRPINVRIYGDMNSWDEKTAITLVKHNGKFESSLPLSAGKYAYRLLVNGRAILDPSNKDSIQSTKAGYNSVLTIAPTNRKALPKLITQSTDIQTVTIGLQNFPDSVFVLWNNFRLPTKIENGIMQIKVPIQAGQLERSYLRVFAYNTAGQSNDLLIPLQNGKVITDPTELNRNDYQANMFYFLPVERFLNGDTLSDKLPHNVMMPISQKKTTKWQKKTTKKFVTKVVVPSPSDSYAGDLVGVLNKLEAGYFRNLGINTLWISPTFQNIVSSKPKFVITPTGKKKIIAENNTSTNTNFDMRIGNHLVLGQIVKEAHQQGLNVFLDITLDPKHQYSSKTPAKKVIFIKKRGLKMTKLFATTTSRSTLAQPELIESMTDSVVIWLKKFNLDGFRNDTTSFTNEAFSRRLAHKIKHQIIIPEKRMICQIAETRDNKSFIYNNVGTGQQNSTLDFDVFFDARNTFALDSEPFSKISNSLLNTIDIFGNHHLLYNAAERERIPRFISYFTGSLTLENENNGDTYKKLLQLHTFYATIPGIPSIYFADEIGRTETQNNDTRHGMKFENLSAEERNIKAITEKLLKWRHSNMAMLYGDFDLLQAEDKTMVYARSYFGKSVIVFFNKDKTERTITINLPKHIKFEGLNPQFGSTISGDNQQITITLAAYSSELLMN